MYGRASSHQGKRRFMTGLIAEPSLGLVYGPSSSRPSHVMGKKRDYVSRYQLPVGAKSKSPVSGNTTAAGARRSNASKAERVVRRRGGGGGGGSAQLAPRL